MSPSNFVLFQDCFGYSGSLQFPHEIKDELTSSCKEVSRKFDTDSIVSIGQLRGMVILTILGIPIHEHEISFHLFRSSLISFNNSL